jgi:hypothetical protein
MYCMNWVRHVALALLLLLPAHADASAQTVGQHQSKLKIPATLFAHSAAQAQSTVRKSDPLWNGALLGAGGGVAAGLLLCTAMESWEICRDDFGSMLKFAALGAGIGAGIDALIRRRVPAAAFRTNPIVGQDRLGMRVTIDF